MCMIKPRFQKACTGFSVKGRLKVGCGKREVEKAGIIDQERRWRIELYTSPSGAERSGCNKEYLADRISCLDGRTGNCLDVGTKGI